MKNLANTSSESLKSGYITANGNILNTKGYFQTQKGDFLRYVGSQEMEHLKSVLIYSTFGTPVPEATAPIWSYLFTIIYNDDSNYYWAMSNNGGCYSSTTESLYFCRNLNGKIEYCHLDYTRSSGEFSQTDSGAYQHSSEIKQFVITDTDLERLCYNDWGNPEEDGEEVSLLDFASTCDLQEVLTACNGGETSNYDDNGSYVGGSESYQNPLTEEELNERKAKLKTLGVEL